MEYTRTSAPDAAVKEGVSKIYNKRGIWLKAVTYAGGKRIKTKYRKAVSSLNTARKFDEGFDGGELDPVCVGDCGDEWPEEEEEEEWPEEPWSPVDECDDFICDYDDYEEEEEEPACKGCDRGITATESDVAPEEYPFPHCSSFEYASKNGVKGAATSNVHNTFVTTTRNDDYRAIRVNIIVLYFTAPNNMTNGQAATRSALALAAAEESAKLWFIENNLASKELLGEAWYGFIQSEMRSFGGSASRNNLNGFTHQPAPFIWNLLTTGDCT